LPYDHAFRPGFRRESTLGAFPNRCKLRSNKILRSSGLYGNSAEKIAEFTDVLVFVAGLTKLNGGFR
jgi:hypothetical protein